MARQPGEAQAAADECACGRQAANRPALLRAEPAGVARLQATAVTGDYLHLAFQILEAQLTLQAVQWVFRVGDGDEFHFTQFNAEVASDVQRADGQVGGAFEQYFLDPGQHLLTQAHTAAAALRHEGGQGADEVGGGVGGIHHQAHLGFPALFHVVSQIFQLAGLLDQLPRAAQQHVAGLGEYGFAPVDAQQRYAELFLHARHGIADRGLRAVQYIGSLGEAALIHHGLQRAPLIQGYTRSFHHIILLESAVIADDLHLHWRSHAGEHQ